MAQTRPWARLLQGCKEIFRKTLPRASVSARCFRHGLGAADSYHAYLRRRATQQPPSLRYDLPMAQAGRAERVPSLKMFVCALLRAHLFGYAVLRHDKAGLPRSHANFDDTIVFVDTGRREHGSGCNGPEEEVKSSGLRGLGWRLLGSFVYPVMNPVVKRASHGYVRRAGEDMPRRNRSQELFVSLPLRSQGIVTSTH